MNFNEYQELSKRTMPAYGNFVEHRDTSCNYIIGLNGESGELSDYLKKHLFYGHELDKDELKKELGDVLHYLAGIATLYEISLEDVAETNITKLSKRYPNGFNVEDSKRRVDVKE